MKSLGSDKSAAKAEKSTSTEAGAASGGDNNGFFTANDKIDFSNVKVEPLFEEEVDFDTFSKHHARDVVSVNALRDASIRMIQILQLIKLLQQI